MSKIEEALKKAKATRGPGETGLRAVAGTEASRTHSNVRDLIPSRDTNGLVARESSSKEIALMKHGELLDYTQLSEMRIIHSEMSDTKTANTYRDLRTKLIQKSQGRNFIAMLTSCVPGEDNSITTLNLATAFSFDESKTSLLIDCNLNTPHLDRLLNMNTDIGLTDYLENDHIDVESILHSTGIKRLKMIPAGTARESSTEYFTSMRMRQLMANLLSRYNDRYIFIDAAPITESADTRILAELCDFVLLVVPYGKVTKNRIKEAADATGKDKLLGVIFNDIPRVPKLKIPNFNKLFGV
jgi:exopolysaccharide/PEP-CTERM locus tyrosine autokinase